MNELAAFRVHAFQQWNQNQGAFWFGGKLLPYNAASVHLLFAGATGSGKTISQRMLYQTTLAPTIGQNLSHRCLAFDAKGDLHRILFGMGIPRSCVITLNPFDKRSSVWDMAADIPDQATAFELSNILIPDAQEQQPFFRQASRDLLTAVMYSHILSCSENGKRWTLRDVLHPFFQTKTALLEATLAKHFETEDRLFYFHNRETAANVLSTLRVLLSPFQTIAALWEEAEREGEAEQIQLGLQSNPRFVSLESWARDVSGKILILGNSQKLQRTLRLINQVIFKRASQILLSMPEVEAGKSRRSWICLDEVRELERLDGLQNLLTQGRSKGVCCVLALQSIEGMRDQNVWGEHVANEIVGQCRNKAFFGVADEATAKWIVGHFGELERIETSWTNSVTRSSRNLDLIAATKAKVEGESRQLMKRALVLDSQLLDLPPTDDKYGLHGFYISPYFRSSGSNTAFHEIHIKPSEIFAGQLRDLSPARDNFEANLRPSPHQRLRQISVESYCARFGIVLEEKSSNPFQDETSGMRTRRLVTED